MLFQIAVVTQGRGAGQASADVSPSAAPEAAAVLPPAAKTGAVAVLPPAGVPAPVQAVSTSVEPREQLAQLDSILRKYGSATAEERQKVDDTVKSILGLPKDMKVTMSTAGESAVGHYMDKQWLDAKISDSSGRSLATVSLNYNKDEPMTVGIGKAELSPERFKEIKNFGSVIRAIGSTSASGITDILQIGDTDRSMIVMKDRMLAVGNNGVTFENPIVASTGNREFGITVSAPAAMQGRLVVFMTENGKISTVPQAADSRSDSNGNVTLTLRADGGNIELELPGPAAKAAGRRMKLDGVELPK